MATNEILPFAQGGGANVQSQIDYAAEPLRSSGNVAGIARSAVNNKALRQASVISAGTAQFLADNQATNITDSLTPTQIAAAFGQAIGTVSGVTSVTMTSTNVTLTDAQAIKSIITISGTLTASVQLIFPTYAKRWTVINSTTGNFSVTCKTASGSGYASLPGTVSEISGDGSGILSGFTSLNAGSGWAKSQDGSIIQWGALTQSTGGASVTFPIAFPRAVFQCVVSPFSNTPVFACYQSSNTTGLFIQTYNPNGTPTNYAVTTSYLAVGY